MKKRIITPIVVFVCLTLLSFVGIKDGIPKSPFDITPLLIGEKIPAHTLKDLKGKEVSLQKLFSKKKTVLIYYRGGWCPFCNKHLSAIGMMQDDLKKMGYQIVAISPDTPSELQKTHGKNKLDYTLLSDEGLKLAQKIGIAYHLDPKTLAKYNKHGIKLTGDQKDLLPVPSVFILNQDASIAFEYINPDYKVRMTEKLLKSVTEALK